MTDWTWSRNEIHRPELTQIRKDLRALLNLDSFFENVSKTKIFLSKFEFPQLKMSTIIGKSQVPLKIRYFWQILVKNVLFSDRKFD